VYNTQQPTVQTRRVTPNDEGGYVRPSTEKKESSLISDRYIVADITFAAEKQSAFYVTTRFNIVREMNNKLYAIGKMVETNSTVYPYIITDEAGTKLWVDRQGNILNSNSRSVGFLKVRK
jgi:hypothetical protein